MVLKPTTALAITGPHPYLLQTKPLSIIEHTQSYNRLHPYLLKTTPLAITDQTLSY